MTDNPTGEPDDTAARQQATELDDLAAETDTTGPEHAGTNTDDDADTGDGDTVTGLCRYGPWHNRTITSRNPEGFLLVDRPTRRAWIYDTVTDQPGWAFYCRDTAARALDDDKRWAAADGTDYDIRVLDDDDAPAPAQEPA